MVEILNMIKILVSWVGNTLRDVAEAKRVYVKSTTKVFEKYGFDYNSPSYDPSTLVPISQDLQVKTKPMKTSSLKENSFFADILEATESPTIKAVWGGMFTYM